MEHMEHKMHIWTLMSGQSCLDTHVWAAKAARDHCRGWSIPSPSRPPAERRAGFDGRGAYGNDVVQKRREFSERFKDVPTPKREHNIHTHYLHRSALTQLAPE